MNTTTTFDPSKHMSVLNSKQGPQEYLAVKWRLLWLRTEHPEACIETVLVQLDPEAGFALFRARVDIPDRGSATGYGSETKTDFFDFIEKAETKAIGRALAALGYGTQFCPDHDMENQDGTPHPADAPVEMQTTVRVMPNPGAPCTDAQIKLIWIRAKTVGMSGDQVEAECRELFPNALGPRLLTKQQASRFIDHLAVIGAPAAEVRA